MYPRQAPELETNKCPYHQKRGVEKDPHFHKPFDYERKKIYDSILDVIGNTPVVRLNNIPKKDNVKCQLYVKCEFLNPGGSVKDRMGSRMIEEAERKGQLKKGDSLIEATSGNAGIGLSLAAAVKGYGMHITLPEKMSTEKVDVLKVLGAKIYKTPTEANFDDDESHIAKALKLRDSIPNSHILDQYTNPGNPLAHYDGTGFELIHQFDGQLDYLFVGTGTGGTISGIGRKIKETMPNCKIVGIDPYGSVLSMPQTKNSHTETILMEGIGYDFVPRVIDRKVVDDWHKIGDKTALPTARRLIKEEGLLVGASSGGVVGGAIEYLKQQGLDQNANLKVCCICADNIRNYITKFVSQHYMYEHQINDIKPLIEENHPLKGRSLEELNLKQVPRLTEKSTINECLEIFKQGFKAIPVFREGESWPSRGILQTKMMECIVNKSLKGSDLVGKVWTQEFSALKWEDLDMAILQRFLERREVSLIVKGDIVYHITPVQMLPFVLQN